jgi:hypothetical protein
MPDDRSNTSTSDIVSAIAPVERGLPYRPHNRERSQTADPSPTDVTRLMARLEALEAWRAGVEAAGVTPVTSPPIPPPIVESSRPDATPTSDPLSAQAPTETETMDEYVSRVLSPAGIDPAVWVAAVLAAGDAKPTHYTDAEWASARALANPGGAADKASDVQVDAPLDKPV